ncbi:UxaA family hydrolase, partial [uncultured Enorma sp.]|uniref:UxaA family hydrolase n=1 Tax=uncultured Enorma sp. TaxID=1714346 RepID=UPI0026087AE7
MQAIVLINPLDNVVVALRPLAAGEVLSVEGAGEVRVAEDIPQGHKMALRALAAGENVVKYGLPIGHATCDIAAGEHVHTHRMATNLSGEVEYSYEPAVRDLEPVEPETMRAFRRVDGRVGIRNEVWILPTVGCVNEVAAALAADAADLVHGSVDGVVAFAHPFGCSQTGADHAQTRKLLAALAHHPNAGGVLVLGLGCENLTHEQFVEELGNFDEQRIRFLICQDVDDEMAAGREILQELVEYAAGFEREDVPVSELVIGMKCGGSDGLSGITAN